MSVLNYNKKELEDVEIKPEHFIELLKLIENKSITELKAKNILRKGVGTQFYKRFLEWSKSKGVNRIKAIVSTKNKQSLNFRSINMDYNY